MKLSGSPRRIALICALSLALASTSCRLFQAPSYNGPDSLPGAGAVLIAHRGRLYSLGGMSSDGQYSDRVRMATIGEDGGLSAWIDTTERPSPRTFYHTLGQDEALALAVDAAV